MLHRKIALKGLWIGGTMELDEAIAVLLQLLQAGQAGHYGYDLYPPQGARAAAGRVHPHHEQDRVARDLSPVFFDAAWELCRRGIVRPGVRRLGDQAVEIGYSLTAAGGIALENLDETT